MQEPVEQLSGWERILEDPGAIGTAFQKVPALVNAPTEELPNILNSLGE